MKSNVMSLLCLLSSFPLGAMEKEIPFSSCEVSDFNREQDMKEIYPIWEENWDNLYCGKPYDTAIVDYLMEPAPGAKKTKVLRHEGAIVGFINFYPNAEKKEIYLDTGSLKKSYQAKGIATYFLPALKNEADLIKAEKMYVHTLKTNEPMLKIWKRMGFEVVDDTLFKGKGYTLEKRLI